MSINNVLIGLAALLLALFGAGCGAGSSSESPTALQPSGSAATMDSLNLLLVLDLSDRLIEQPGQPEKDQAIIEGILAQFAARQKRQAYLRSEDRLRLLLARQPEVPSATSDSLSIDMSQKRMASPDGKRLMAWPKYKEEQAQFQAAVANAYGRALASPFTGADLYTMFCTELPQNFLDPARKNRIVVLTDGYLTFDRKYLAKRPACTYMRELDKLRREKERWLQRFERKQLALCPCEGARFPPGTKVMVLETAPKFQGQSVYEFAIVEHYWKTWFEAMGVPLAIYPQNDLVSDINSKVEAFLE